MARTLDTGLEAAIARRGTEPGWLILIDGPTGTLRYSTRGTLTHDGSTWTGGAVLSGVEFSGNLAASVTLELPNTDNSASALALSDLLRDSAVTLYAYYADSGHETELLTANSDFDTWTNKLNLTITSGAEADPDGGSDADLIYEPLTASGFHYVRQAVSLVPGETYRFACSLKQINRRFAFLQVTTTTPEYPRSTFDLQDGDVGTISGGGTVLARNIDALGDGWYRCSIDVRVGAAGTATAYGVVGIADDSENIIFAGTGQDAFYAYDARLRRGTAAAYATALSTLVIDAVESISSTRVELSLSSIAEGASRLPDVLVGPPLCNHIPPAGTVIKWGSTSITLERE